MANRTRRLPEADRLARWQLLEVGRELRIARLRAGLRLVDVGRAVHRSASML